MDDARQGPAEGHQPAVRGDAPNNARNGVVLAHTNLLRARNLCWLALALLAVGIPLSFAWQAGGLALAGLAAIAYVVALGFMSIAGNHLGQFGLKYPLAAIVGTAALAQLVMPLAGFIAPVAVFFWLKGEVGNAYRAQVAADGVPALATSGQGQD